MTQNFNIDIISPSKSIFSSELSEATIPAYEGEMGVLKDHIPLITFLRPGFIIVKNEEEKKFYIEEGTVEFSNNNLLILTSAVKDLKNLDKASIDISLREAQKKLNDEKSSDKEKYIISYKIETLKEINQ